MKSLWLNKKNENNKLILFLNGWAMNETAVSNLQFKDYDVLMVNDYSSIEPDFFSNLLNNEALKKYSQKYLVCWSMGVYAANLYCDFLSKFDKKILIEEGIDGREVECAVLGNEEIKSSCVGEIKAADEFYSYDAKYKNQESKTLIPANISEEKSKEIQKLAIKAFKAIDGKGLSRVDFFIEKDTEKVYINEINTLPGFTSISMYPKLFEQVGVGYTELLDKLIDLAL